MAADDAARRLNPGWVACSRSRVAAKAVQRIVDWFCNGSIEEVLVGMVDNAMLDQKQLRMLAEKVEKAKAKAKGTRK